jgi:hypothetical protein
MVAVELIMALPLGIRSGLWCDHDEPTVAEKLWLKLDLSLRSA